MAEQRQSRRQFMGIVGAGAVTGLASLSAAGRNRPDVDAKRMQKTTNGSGDWPMFGGDLGNTGSNPGAEPPTDGVSLSWQDPLANPTSQPAAVDGLLFVGDEYGTFSGIDLETGAVVDRDDAGWLFSFTPTVTADRIYHVGDHPIFSDSVFALEIESESDGDDDPVWEVSPESGVSTSVAVAEGRVVVGGNEIVYAFDADTGDERWTLETETGVDRTPAIANETVYVSAGPTSDFVDESPVLYALDVDDGTEQWTFEDGAEFLTTPAVADGTVFVGTGSTETDGARFVALDAETGGLEWERELGTIDQQRPPAVADGTVYALAGEWVADVVALDAADGTERWRFSPTGEIPSQPIVAGGVLYLVTSTGSVYAVEAATGDRLWEATLPLNDDPAIAVADDRVVVAGNTLAVLEPGDETDLEASGTGLPTDWSFDHGADGFGAEHVTTDGNDETLYLSSEETVYAIDPDDGTSVREFEVNDETSAYTSEDVVGEAVSVGETLYFASDDGLVYSRDAETGSTRWDADVGGTLTGSPAVAGDGIYVSSEDGTAYGIDDEDGSERWAVDVAEETMAAPAATDDTVFVTGETELDATMYALDAETGDELWTTDCGDVESTPTVADGIVFVDGNYELQAIDAATGEEYWAVDVEDTIVAPPTVADGMVYAVTGTDVGIAAEDGVVHAVDIETGTEHWTVETGDAIFASPVVIDGTVYVGNERGLLFAIEAQTGDLLEWRQLDDAVGSLATIDGDERLAVGFESDYLQAIDVTETVRPPIDRSELAFGEPIDGISFDSAGEAGGADENGSSGSDSGDDETDDTDGDGESDGDDTADDSTPGLGIGAALTGLTGAGLYWGLSEDAEGEADSRQ